jgi:hypothetical protein
VIPREIVEQRAAAADPTRLTIAYVVYLAINVCWVGATFALVASGVTWQGVLAALVLAAGAVLALPPLLILHAIAVERVAIARRTRPAGRRL